MYQTNLDKRSLRSALLLGAASVAVVSLSAPALAQDQATETVVVTGSRIPQQGLYAASPVTAVGQQEIKYEGSTNVENLLNNLPSVFAAQTNTQSNGSTGTAQVNLRGLGPTRTLVLVDNTRLMPADVASPEADLNNIPAALVDHVEVLTGGASAVYGSDAEAGVVNFIMRKNFEGIELDGQYSVNEASNSNGFDRGIISPFLGTPGFAEAPSPWFGGRTNDATLLIGTNTSDGRGNVTAYMEMRSTAAVLESQRDFSACSVSVSKHDAHVCAGSANFNTWVSLDDYYAGTNYLWHENGNATPGSGTFVPYTGAPNQKFNYGALNYLQRPDTRYTAGFFAHYQVNHELDVYSNFMFADDHTVAQIAPSGAFLGHYPLVNCNNPLMTAQEAQALCGNDAVGAGCTPIGTTGNCNLVPGQATVGIGRRDIEGGDRTDDLRHTAYRFKIGAKGDLGDGWSYDMYGQYGYTIYTEAYSNEWSISRVQNALEVDPTTGKCYAAEPNAQGYIADPTCQPLDIFNGIGSANNTPKGLAYVNAQGLKEGWTQEEIVSGALTGDLGEWGGQSPWAQNPIAMSIGSEYRQERMELTVSRDFQTGDLYGQGAKTLPVPASGFDVVEGFTEVKVPLVQGKPFVEDLTFNAGYRYSSYSTAGSVSAYKYGAEWQPIDDIRVRGSYDRAVRAPNVIELFAPANAQLFGGQDPCASPTSATILANCHAHGVPNAGSGILSCPAAQCTEQVQGNLALHPEITDSRTLGVVLTPTFLDGFTATIDYFNIKISDYINAPDPNTTLSACYGAGATAISQAVACPLVIRDPVTHSIHDTSEPYGLVSAQTVNDGTYETNGFDFEANYQAGFDQFGLTGYGSITANFVGTLVHELTLTPFAGFTSYNCAGLFGVTCGSPTPKWRHKLRVTWETPWDVDISMQWRHLSGVALDLNTNNPLLNATCGASGYPCPDLADGHIGAYDYFDLSANWTVREGVELRAGVDNLFDRDPPLLDSNSYGISGPSQFGNGNTYPGVYDSLGRTIFVGATIKY